MNCKEFSALVDGYLDCSLQTPLKARFEAHATTCPTCWQSLENSKLLFATLGELDEDIYAPDTLMPAVMIRIAQDKPQKRRRHFIPIIATSIAAALVLTAGLTMLLSGTPQMSNPSAMRKYSTPAADTGGELSNDYAPAPNPAGAPATFATDQESGDSVQEDALTQPNNLQEDPAQMGTKIIRDVSLRMNSERYDDDLSAIAQITQEFDGYITAKEEAGSAIEPYASENGKQRSAYMILRIPNDDLDAFLTRLKTVGVTIHSSIQETDITALYSDVTMRLSTYEIQHARLIELLAKAETVEDLLAIESELSRLQYEIDASKASLKGWDNRVNYSTITIDLAEVKRTVPVAPTLSEQLSIALSTSWDGFVDGARNALVGLYASVPYAILWLLILGILAIPTTLIVRALRRKRNP